MPDLSSGRRTAATALLDAMGDPGKVVDRGTILPLGTYEDGSTGLAWPSILHDPVQSVGRLWDNAPAAADPSASPEVMSQTGEDLFNIGGAVGLGSFAAPKPQNAVGMFGGRLAKTADQAALSRAEQMASQGVPREQIWSDTGWFKGVDGKWRFEIDDSASRSTSQDALRQSQARAVEMGRPDSADAMPQKGWGGKSSSTLSHNKLYAAYPELADIFTAFLPKDAAGLNGVSGVFTNGQVRISKDLPVINQHSVHLHELQHAIQSEEGFARGTNIGFETKKAPLTTNSIIEQMRREHADRIFNDPIYVRSGEAAAEWARILRLESQADEAYGVNAYKTNAGETEARTVQKRQNLNADERRARPPWLDYDVPESDQIIRFGNGGPSMSIDQPSGALGNRAASALLDEGPKGFTAYHGSPHDFDKFDMSKIGTGEGAQAYGHGLYFAESEGVAQSYRDGLSPGSFAIDGTSVQQTAMPWLKEYMTRDDKSLASVLTRINNGISSRESRRSSLAKEKGNKTAAHIGESLKKEIEIERNRADALRSYLNEKQDANAGWNSNGHMYQVRINANPDDFLDWDKPLSQQPRAAEILKSLQLPMGAIDDLGGDVSLLHNSEMPREFYDALSSLSGVGDVSGASKLIGEAGIPGIKYLDQGSRTAGEGSRNYVLFRDDIIDIVKKYGIAAAALMYGEQAVQSAMDSGASVQTDY